ncbi:unnamed protein product [Rhodiola kirilowii]
MSSIQSQALEVEKDYPAAVLDELNQFKKPDHQKPIIC